MVWQLREKEISAVSALEPVKRYEYFIRRVADEGRVWGLWNDGWVLAKDEFGGEQVPVWPNEKFAIICAREEWIGCVPKEIGINTFISKWLPGIQKDKRKVSVFPTIGSTVVTADAMTIKSDLVECLESY